MYSRCLRALLFACVFASNAASAGERELRVCADPDNLPYSHEDGSGFENRIAELVARDLGASLTYSWLAQRRGFVRKTLNADLCDVIMGVPRDFELVRTTAPYYRSTYGFVYRRDAARPFASFDDPHLRTARIGVQLIGNDLATTPPGHALAARGITDNVIGYVPYGDRPQPQEMIEAVAQGTLDVALVWGPQAAYYARRAAVPLALSPAHAPADLSHVPFEYSISMGVRKRDAALAKELDAVIEKRRSDIEAILREYGVPRVGTSLANGRAP
jgi:quinoprotein dehydrogenase-associated probable ABC transporter substrate-binding protein